MGVLSFLGFKKLSARNLRKFQRIRIPLLIRYQMNKEGEGKISNLSDLAAGGVRFTTEDLIPIGTRIHLQVKLPWREKPLDVIGKVTRCAKLKGTPHYRVATQFVGMKKEDLTEVESFVDMLAGKRRKPKRK